MRACAHVCTCMCLRVGPFPMYDMCLCVYTRVVYVCTGSLYARAYLRVHVCLCVWCVSMCAYMCVYMCLCVLICVALWVEHISVCDHVSVHVFVCLHVSMYRCGSITWGGPQRERLTAPWLSARSRLMTLVSS